MSFPKKTSAKRKKKKASRQKSYRGLIFTLIVLILILIILSMYYLISYTRNARANSRIAEAATNYAIQTQQPADETAEASAQPTAVEEAPVVAAAQSAEEEAPAAQAVSAEEESSADEASALEEASAEEEAEPSPSAKASEKSDKKSDTKSVTISFAGDCTFASYYGARYARTFEATYEENGEDYFFQNVKKYFEADDLTVVNLEGTFTTSTDRVKKTFNFKSDPSYVGILDAGDIECVNLANNHTHDYSESGYEETIETLNKDGIRWFGGEDTCLMEVNGIKIGFSGIYECESGISCKDQAVQNVEDLKDAGAEVIVCEFHWGDENSYSPNSVAVQLAHAVIDAGADLVIGHHPHVLQGIELYNGKYICYSLGNFCFGGNPGGKDFNTMIFQTTFEVTNGKAEDNADFTIIPCSTSTDSSKNTYCPTPATGEKAQKMIDRIYKICGYISNGITADTPHQTVILEPDETETEETADEAEADDDSDADDDEEAEKTDSAKQSDDADDDDTGSSTAKTGKTTKTAA